MGNIVTLIKKNGNKKEFGAGRWCKFEKSYGGLIKQFKYYEKKNEIEFHKPKLVRKEVEEILF